jgi:putative pyruvate formate lyase activating enzyme
MQNNHKIALIDQVISCLADNLDHCKLCPRNCGVNRAENEHGYCLVNDLVVYSAFLHQGEEPALCEGGGSGAIFFSGCSLKCVYCQNYKFSHFSKGKCLNETELAQIMLKLQNKGACNINLVSPTHLLLKILGALKIAFSQGLKIPLVYNSSGYEKSEIIEKLDGIIDIYLPDLKYSDKSLASKYSAATDYPDFNQTAIKEMYRQTETKFVYDQHDILQNGLIIRHLVLPGHIENSFKALSWIKRNCPQALTSVMFQYQPYFKAKQHIMLRRRINLEEHTQVKDFIETLSLNGWVQDFHTQESLAGVYFDALEDI